MITLAYYTYIGFFFSLALLGNKYRKELHKNFVYFRATVKYMLTLIYIFNCSYKSSTYDTVSGLLINKINALPKTHDVITIDQFKFQIKISDQRRIHSIQVEIKN